MRAPGAHAQRRVALLRKRARRVLDQAGIEVGGERLVEPLAAAIDLECEKIRGNVAGMLRTLHKRGDALRLSRNPAYDGALLDLAHAIEHSFVDDDGVEHVEVDE